MVNPVYGPSVHMLPFPSHGGVAKSGQNADHLMQESPNKSCEACIRLSTAKTFLPPGCTMQASKEVMDGNSHLHRLTLHLAGHAHETAHRLIKL